MSRRIKKELSKFFTNADLSVWERSFIDGCLDRQNEYPQLTKRQWEYVMKIYHNHTRIQNESNSI